MKQSPAGCNTHWNTVATGRVPRQRSRPELEKREKLWRLGRLGRELGGAPGPQGGGEYGSVLNLARKERSAVDFRERDVEFLRPWTARTDGVVHVGAQVEGGASSGRPRRLAMLAGRQAACLRTRTRRCVRSGRAGQGAGDPYRITVATLIPSFLNFVKFNRNLNWSQICVKTKVVPNFISYKTCFGDQS